LLFVLAIGMPAASGAQKIVDPKRVEALTEPCAKCHGAPIPQPATPVLAGQNREFLVLQMFYMREGLRDVPPMAGALKHFSDRDLEDVASHFARMPAPAFDNTRESALHERGAALSRSMGCGSCHLADYRGQKHVPRITHQREDYLAATLKAYRDNQRTGTDTSMNAAMYQVTDTDIAALAHYLAHR
jgi:cytochrome c553